MISIGIKIRSAVLVLTYLLDGVSSLFPIIKIYAKGTRDNSSTGFSVPHLSSLVHLEATLRLLELTLLLLLDCQLGEEQGRGNQRCHRSHDTQAEGPAYK